MNALPERMRIIGKIIWRLERHRYMKKDFCESCRWYIPENACCHMKKCSGHGGYGYVTRWDRKHCSHQEPGPIAKVTEIEKTDRGIKARAEMLPGAKEMLEQIGVDLGESESKTVFWADGKQYETFEAATLTPNACREAHGYKTIEKKKKRCEYCGTISERDYGTCEHCGAPL